MNTQLAQLNLAEHQLDGTASPVYREFQGGMIRRQLTRTEALEQVPQLFSVAKVHHAWQGMLSPRGWKTTRQSLIVGVIGELHHYRADVCSFLGVPSLHTLHVSHYVLASEIRRRDEARNG